MDWTFIICTHDPNQQRLDDSLKTIMDLKIPNFEILVIGGERKNYNYPTNVKFLSFDEESRAGWITKKKNEAAKLASYSNLCVCHDYFAFDFNWYNEWILFNNIISDWEIACNSIQLINGVRGWTDWIAMDLPNTHRTTPLLYTVKDKTKYQYVSGGYFCIKRDYFLKNPFSEQLGSHEEEDIEWSNRLKNTWKLVMNENSIVRHIKWHRDADVWQKHMKRLKKQSDE